MKAGLIFFLHFCLSKKNWQNHRQLAEMEKDIYIKNNDKKKKKKSTGRRQNSSKHNLQVFVPAPFLSGHKRR